jgi:hypothetical protein
MQKGEVELFKIFYHHCWRMNDQKIEKTRRNAETLDGLARHVSGSVDEMLGRSLIEFIFPWKGGFNHEEISMSNVRILFHLLLYRQGRGEGQDSDWLLYFFDRGLCIWG